MRRLAPLFVATLVVLSCDAPEPTLSPEVPLQSSADVKDGASTPPGPNAFFFFLPPIVGPPSVSGVPNQSLAPRIEICPLVRPIYEVCERDGSGNVIVQRAFDHSEITVGADDYSVDWDTGAETLGSLGYRIHVYLDDELLGYRDVAPVPPGGFVPPAPAYYSFPAGDVLPINFRIELGVICGGLVDCVEGILSPVGITTPEGKANISAATAPPDPITITVHRIPVGPGERCIDELDMPQAADLDSGCYRVELESVLPGGVLPGPATVSLCVDLGLLPPGVVTHPQEDAMPMFRSDEGSPPVIETLATVAANIDCSGVFALGSPPLSDNPVMRLAQRGWRTIADPVRGWLGPRPLYAVVLDAGRGGQTSVFSLFTVAQTGTYSKSAGDGLVAPVGSPVTPPPSVSVVDPTGAGVIGARVRFMVASGGGDLDPPPNSDGESIVFTDGSGIAALNDWTLGPNPGLQTVTAQISGAAPVGGVTFSATACGAGSASGTATIDGVVDADEWACASSLPFAANLSGGSTPAVWYWMRDADNLYLAVTIERDSEDRVNTLIVNFDDDGDGPSLNDDVVELNGRRTGPNQLVDRHLVEKCLKSKQSRCGDEDDQQDGFGVFTNDGTVSTYEMSIPLGSTDGEDIEPMTGVPVRAYLTLAVGRGAQGNTEVPGFRVYQDLFTP